MARGAGFAPTILVKMPFWYARAILRLVIRQREWQKMEPLLDANLAEHEQVAVMDSGTVERFRSVTADVLLLGGEKESLPYHNRSLYPASACDCHCHRRDLSRSRPCGPERQSSPIVAARVADFLTGPMT
jgi:hypothetical protein